MNKQELIKRYKQIVFKTNGGNDDYVVALCQIGEAYAELQVKVKDLERKNKRLEEIATAWSEEASRKFAVIKELEQQLEDRGKDIEECWAIFNDKNQRVTQFICEDKAECDHKIKYWLGGKQEYKPVKVGIRVIGEK